MDITPFITGLASLGLPGIIIAGLAYYVNYLVRKKDELQEARLQEYKLLLDTVRENTVVMHELQKVITHCEKAGADDRHR